MQKTKATKLLAKFTVKDNPFRAIIPFLLATLLFVVTITPLYPQFTQETKPSMYENQTILKNAETATASLIKPDTSQSTSIFCPNCGNQLLITEGSCPFCNSNLNQLQQTTKK